MSGALGEGDGNTPDTPEPPVEKTECPDYADKVLKVYPYYDSLYIDHQGGAYTPGTPEHIRGKAVLYQNPYNE